MAVRQGGLRAGSYGQVSVTGVLREARARYSDAGIRPTWLHALLQGGQRQKQR